MKHFKLSLIISSFLLSTSLSFADNTQQLLQQSHQAVQHFGKSLKGELKAAMKQGGPINAIKVCNEKAMEITSAASKDNKVQLSRTSLKVRNPANIPEPWEKEILKQFEKRKAQGESAKKMEFSEIIEINGKKQFRYMKAMAISKPCLHCHGEKIQPAVDAKINQLYPSDKARDYKLGDIRGAIVLVRDL